MSKLSLRDVQESLKLKLATAEENLWLMEREISRLSGLQDRCQELMNLGVCGEAGKLMAEPLLSAIGRDIEYDISSLESYWDNNNEDISKKPSRDEFRKRLIIGIKLNGYAAKYTLTQP